MNPDRLNAAGARPTRRLLLLGASGSVGQNALEYVKNLAKETGNDGSSIELTGVSVHRSLDTLESILSQVPLACAAISDKSVFQKNVQDLRMRYPETLFFGGPAGLIEMIRAGHQEFGADTVLTAVVGSAGIQATVEAIRLGLKIALANKETLVTAGPPILAELERARKEGKAVSILPVDSEHNALFQLLYGQIPSHIHRVILTASGGPFFEFPLEELAGVTRDQVLAHPTWSMGPKITVDSAGMINKGLEIIEAHYLFDLSYEKLDAVIHRKSIVHGMIETSDGGFHLCASQPDMVFPIAHSLHFPDPVPRAHPMATGPSLWGDLSFHPVDLHRYPGFRLALEAGKRGGTATAIYNGANERAVELFLEGDIGFTDIPELIELVLDEMEVFSGTDLELYLESDQLAREKLTGQVRKRR